MKVLDFKKHNGKELYAISTGKISITMKRSRKAVDFISKRKGFIALHMTNDGVLWFFDSLNNAKVARNKCEEIGIVCGINISKFKVNENFVDFLEVI